MATAVARGMQDCAASHHDDAAPSARDRDPAIHCHGARAGVDRARQRPDLRPGREPAGPRRTARRRRARARRHRTRRVVDPRVRDGGEGHARAVGPAATARDRGSVPFRAQSDDLGRALHTRGRGGRAALAAAFLVDGGVPAHQPDLHSAARGAAAAPTLRCGVRRVPTPRTGVDPAPVPLASDDRETRAGRAHRRLRGASPRRVPGPEPRMDPGVLRGGGGRSPCAR
jgi:hypothetical protein